MSRALGACALIAALATTACAPDMLPPRGQVLLHADTDAPLPPGPGGTLGEWDPTPLFDRIRFDVLFDGEAPCAECSRDFDVDADMFRDRVVSIGIVPPGDGRDVLVRTRLFRAAGTLHGEPRWDSTIDVLARLPDIDDEGVIDLSVLLPTELAGRVSDPAAPTEAHPGAIGTSAVGTWPGAQRVPCVGAPMPGEVCIPGGAFWMGNPLVAGLNEISSADQQRLVVLSPFFLHAREMTVGRFNTVPGSSATIGNSVIPWSGDDTGDSEDDFCAWSKLPERQDLAINCLPQLIATLICGAFDATLPTEAQFEYVASGLGGQLYPWGSDEPSCEDAVWGRAGIEGTYEGFASDCRGDSFGGVAAPGTGLRDAIRPPGAAEDVVDLAGNLREVMRDRWNRQGEPCWPAGVVLHDPLCPNSADSVDGKLRTIKGGSWLDYPEAMRAASRDAFFEKIHLGAIGFRCARPGIPPPP